MNMAITSAPTSPSAATGSTAGMAAGTNAGSGFAGLLIQAIGGGGSNGNVATSLPPGIALIGSIGQSGEQKADGQPQDVLALLTQLMEQLQQLEQADTVPQEIQDQLAAMLHAFQGMLQQLGQPIVNVTESASLSSGSASSPAVNALQQTLQQLSKALTDKSEAAGKAYPLIGQLKAAVDSLVQNSVSNNTVPVPAAPQQKDASASAATTAFVLRTVDTAAAEASKQTAPAVVAEINRPVSALRDPVWKSNIIDGAETTVTESSQTAAPTVVTSGDTAGGTASHPAWTFMQTDSLITGDSVQGKSGLPAQVPVQQFAQQMEKFLVKQFALTQGNGTTEAKLTLTPENLGQVDVRIVMQNGHLTAHFMTDNAMARDLLESQMSHLRAALHGQGLQVERLEVVQQPSSSSNMSFLQHDGRQPGSGSNRSGAGGSGKSGSYDDTAIFEAELERTSSLREFGYGSSLNVTA
ncbi:hypothetical protein SD71_14750 [Cohnella kolymensis]|uniref:Flagellar hook-length control protein-like C-terminal domain-containing protein n=1 Tax=Cohnella kolymensis TaxID=1590652 RepID=A0ABR5A2K0_9BACL|nr:flagellar hook-length control protein FliK [Cohnella kolymensis]KIL35291.1 hypothetical protein SD71_14750 [Cohnella kolymensis]